MKISPESVANLVLAEWRPNEVATVDVVRPMFVEVAKLVIAERGLTDAEMPAVAAVIVARELAMAVLETLAVVLKARKAARAKADAAEESK